MHNSLISLTISLMLLSHSVFAETSMADRLNKINANDGPVEIDVSTLGKSSNQVNGVNSQTVTNAPPPLPALPPIERKTVEESKTQAFETIKNTIAPMDPEMIRKFKQYIDEQQKANSETPEAPAKPVVSTLMVNLDPGTTPPVVRLAAGFVTSLVFVDSTGAAWPINKATPADGEIFHIEQAEANGNVVTASTIRPYAHGNVAIHLKGQPTPVMITLVSGQKEVDYRADLHIQTRGPNAVAPITYTQEKMKVNHVLMSILDGIPPTNAQPLLFNGEPNIAWMIDGQVYVRTKMTLLSPEWIGHQGSPNGMHAYQIIDSPVLLFSDSAGVITQVQLKEKSWQTNQAQN